MKVSLDNVISQTPKHYHRNPIISQYQIIYTLSLSDTSTKSHQMWQIRQSKLYLLPTMTLLHQSTGNSASWCNIVDINTAKCGAALLNRDHAGRMSVKMLLQSVWHLDCSSGLVTLSIVPKQEGKGGKCACCFMLSLPRDQCLLLIVWSYS